MRYLFGTTRQQQNGGMSRSYREDEKIKAVEEMVRTYMLAGLTAKDLYDADNPTQS